MDGKRRERQRYTTSTVQDQVYSYTTSGRDGTYGETLETYTQEYNPTMINCRDVVGNYGGNNEFFLSNTTFQPLNAQSSLSIMSNDYVEGYEDDRPVTHTVASYTDIGSYVYGDDRAMSDEELFTQFCAETNPSAAAFDAAVFAAELRDVPGLLRSAGDRMSKFGANEYLKYQYGWVPLASDMKKMLHAYDNLAKRLKNVERLATSHSVKRRSRVAEDSSFGTNYSDNHPHYLRSVHEWRYVTRRWAVVEWIPHKAKNILSDVLPLTRNLTPLNRAKQALYGGVVDGSTLWEAMPWSWLLDWGSNASEYLKAKRNIVGAEVGYNSCLMSSTSYQRQSQFVLGDVPVGVNATFRNLESGIGYEVEKTKSRRVGMKPTIVAADALDLIGKSAFKQSILGALAVQRLRRLPF